MATATRIQMWTYGALLLLDTLLATLLGTALAEAASIESSRRDSSKPSPLSLLVGGFSFSLATFAYLLMFLIVRQLHPNSQLVWLATDCVVLTMLAIFGFGCAIAFTVRGVLDLGSCVQDSAHYCNLAVGSGALLWVCSVLIIGMLAYILIIKAVNHPGREAWARSVGALTGSKKNVKTQATSTRTTSNRGSAITVEDPFAEPEALRPFLSMDLVADENRDSSADNSPSRTARYPSSSSNPYGSSSHSQSQAPHSRSYHSLQDHSESQLSLPRASTSHNSPRGNRDRASTISDNRVSQDPYDHPLALTPSHSRKYSDLSHNSPAYDYADMPPVPPLPQVILDEKRRVRQPQAIVDEKRRERQPQAVLNEKRCDRASIFRPPYSEPASAKGKGRIPLRIQPPEPGIRREEGAIVSAASDVFSVMADFAGSPRSPRTLTDPFPPMALPLPGTPGSSTFSPSREVTPRPVAHSFGGQGMDVWQEQVRRDEAPPYTPPLTGGQWCGNGAGHRPMPSLGSSSGLHGWSEDLHAKTWDSPYAAAGTTSPVRPNLPGTRSFNSSASGYPFPSASWGHDGSLSHESGSSLTPHTYADALDYRPFTVPRPANACSSGLEDEASLFFNRAPRQAVAKPPTPSYLLSQSPPKSLVTEDATLFFNRPPLPTPPFSAGPAVEEDEATLFFSRKVSR